MKPPIVNMMAAAEGIDATLADSDRSGAYTGTHARNPSPARPPFRHARAVTG